MKTSKTILIASIAAITLSACGATTGGLQNALMQKAASEAVMASMTQTEGATPITAVVVTPVVVTADMSPRCVKVAEQIATVDAQILAANEVLGNEGTATFAGQAAAAAASQGIVSGGATNALSKIPFGGMFAKQALDGMAKSGKRKADKARKQLNVATVKRAKLVGKFEGMECVAS